MNQTNDVSALGLQRVLGFGSYQTASAWLHKLRRDGANVFRIGRVTDDENPFVPRLEGVPLKLTFDGRSLATLSADALREARFLLMLAQTPAIDGLLLEAPDGFAAGIPRAFLDESVQNDSRLIRPLDYPKGFLGGVQPWSSRERRADELGLTGTARERFLYYEAVTWWHRNSKRHYFVTAERDLLADQRPTRGQHNWSGRRIINVRAALAFVGWVMRSRELIYLEARSGYRQTTTNFDYYFRIAHALAPARLRLHDWIKQEPQGKDLDQLNALAQALHFRCADLLRARDGVAFQTLRQQDNATLDALIYHVHAAVPGAAALCDAVALFASVALSIEEDEVGGATGVTLRQRKFRKALRERGATELADRAASLQAWWRLLAALRDPIVHRAGLSGVGYVLVPGAHESRLTPSDMQAAAIAAYASTRGETTSDWGLDETDGWGPTVNPLPFMQRLTTAAIAVGDDLAAALAEGLGAPAPDDQSWDDSAERAWRLALLGGLVTHLRRYQSPPNALRPLGP